MLRVASHCVEQVKYVRFCKPCVGEPVYSDHFQRAQSSGEVVTICVRVLRCETDLHRRICIPPTTCVDET